MEPLDQEHRESGLGPLLVTRWMHPDREARYAWVPIPPEPATPDEAVDRVLEQYAAVVQERLRTFLSTNGPASSPLVIVMSVPSHGDGVDVSSPSELPPQLAEWFPNIARAISEQPPRGHVPVFVFMGQKAGLRWMALPGEGATASPRSLLESVHWPPEAGEPPPFGSRPPDQNEKPKRQKRSPEEMFEVIMRMTCFDEIDVVLGALSENDLDHAIASVGFDPAIERAHGPGLRDRVVRAIANRRLDENPPEGV